jgi:hypothetical protein
VEIAIESPHGSVKRNSANTYLMGYRTTYNF